METEPRKTTTKGEGAYLKGRSVPAQNPPTRCKKALNEGLRTAQQTAKNQTVTENGKGAAQRGQHYA